MKNKKLPTPKEILDDKVLNNWSGLEEIINDSDIFYHYMGVIEENMIYYGKLIKKSLKKKNRKLI